MTYFVKIIQIGAHLIVAVLWYSW